MIVNIKKLHKNAVIPFYAKPNDAGMDLVAVSKEYDNHGNVSYGTGLAFEIPEGYVGLLFPRSSNSKQDLLLANSVGILDSDYRGEVLFKYKPSLAVFKLNNGEHIAEVPNNFFMDKSREYEVGDRIGQIIIIPFPKITFNEVDELSRTDRGEGGFGSTGK